MQYRSPVLFHGPAAHSAALSAANRLGRVLRDFGEEGLKIADSREFLEVMDGAPVGDVPGVVILGPMDRAQQAATDVLLKTLEEFDPDQVRPVLWAFDETEVSPTIRSRCLRRWCPGSWNIDEDLLGVARELVEEAICRRRVAVIELLKDRDPRGILEAVAAALNERGIDDHTRPLWVAVREVTQVRHPSSTEVLAAFLLEAAA